MTEHNNNKLAWNSKLQNLELEQCKAEQIDSDYKSLHITLQGKEQISIVGITLLLAKAVINYIFISFTCIP